MIKRKNYRQRGFIAFVLTFVVLISSNKFPNTVEFFRAEKPLVNEVATPSNASLEKENIVSKEAMGITPFATSDFIFENKDGYDVPSGDGDRYFDLARNILIDYSNLEAYGDGLSYNVATHFTRNDVIQEVDISYGETINLSMLEDGEYLLTASSRNNTTGLSDTGKIFLNYETILAEARHVGGSGNNYYYNPTGVSFISYRTQGSDQYEPLRVSSNVWGIVDINNRLVAGGRYVEKNEAGTIKHILETANGFETDYEFGEGSNVVDKNIGPESSGAVIELKDGIYKGITSVSSYTKHGNLLPLQTEEDKFILIYPRTEIDGVSGNGNVIFGEIRDSSNVYIKSKYQNDSSELASVTRWEVLKEDGNPVSENISGEILSGNAETLDLTRYGLAPGNYVLSVEEVIKETSESHITWMRFVIKPQSIVKVEYYKEKQNGLDRTDIDLNLNVRHSDYVGNIMQTIQLSNEYIPVNHKFYAVEVNIDAEEPQIMPLENYLATFPEYEREMTVKYVYRENMPDTTILVTHVWEDDSKVEDGAKDMIYTGTPESIQNINKLDEYELLKLFIDGIEKEELASVEFPSSGKRAVVYMYKKVVPPITTSSAITSSPAPSSPATTSSAITSSPAPSSPATTSSAITSSPAPSSQATTSSAITSSTTTAPSSPATTSSTITSSKAPTTSSQATTASAITSSKAPTTSSQATTASAITSSKAPTTSSQATTSSAITSSKAPTASSPATTKNSATTTATNSITTSQKPTITSQVAPSTTNSLAGLSNTKPLIESNTNESFFESITEPTTNVESFEPTTVTDSKKPIEIETIVAHIGLTDEDIVKGFNAINTNMDKGKISVDINDENYMIKSDIMYYFDFEDDKIPGGYTKVSGIDVYGNPYYMLQKVNPTTGDLGWNTRILASSSAIVLGFIIIYFMKDKNNGYS